jgi:hypothetical protein
MTAKQRAARAKFKAVVAEAKKLRKKNPKLTQAQAVKQAFAISYGKKRAGVGETHKDTKSHNVNIRVVSGIKKKKKIGSAYLDRLKEQQAKAERERDAEKTKRQRPAAASRRVREVLKKQGLKMPSGYKVSERIISGIDSKIYQVRDLIEKDIKYYLEGIDRLKKDMPSVSKFEQQRFKESIRNFKKIILKLKKQLREQNSLIAQGLK